MTRLKTTLIAVAAAFSSTMAFAHDYKVGGLSIDHPMSFATPPGAVAGAGYMTITNNGSDDDRLVGVGSDFPRTMIHKSEEVDGVMKMRHQHGGVVIPAGETVTFEPGGLHIMFMGLKAPLKDGEKNKVTLTFENAGDIDVTFNVEKRDLSKKAKSEDHSGHGAKDDHSGHSN